jgi:hypothetical protein
MAIDQTSRRPVGGCSPRSHRPPRATLRGHEHSEAGSAWTWPDMNEVAGEAGYRTRPTARWRGRTRNVASGGPQCRPVPRPVLTRDSAASAQTRLTSRPRQPRGPATCANAAQASMPRVWLLPGRRPPGTNQAVLPLAAPPCVARPGQVSRPRLAAPLKQIRNTMSGISRSVVYGVTVGKRERNPLMGNMKRSRRTLKWPAGFS